MTARIVAYPRFPTSGPVRGHPFVVVDVIHLGSPDEADVLLRPSATSRPSSRSSRRPACPRWRASRWSLSSRCRPWPTPKRSRSCPQTPSTASSSVLVASRGPLVVSRACASSAARWPAPDGQRRPGRNPRRVRGVRRRHCGKASRTVRGHRGRGGRDVALRPFAAPQVALNLAETSRDPASFWPPEAYDRLRRIKGTVDPGNLFSATTKSLRKPDLWGGPPGKPWQRPRTQTIPFPCKERKDPCMPPGQPRRDSPAQGFASQVAALPLRPPRVHPPLLRTADGHDRDERRASWLELFFDLAFAAWSINRRGVPAASQPAHAGRIPDAVSPIWWLWWS